MNRRSFLLSSAAAVGSFVLWSPLARAFGRDSSVDEILRECARSCSESVTQQLADASGLAGVAANQLQGNGRISPAIVQSLTDACRRALNNPMSPPQREAIGRCLHICETRLIYA